MVGWVGRGEGMRADGREREEKERRRGERNEKKLIKS